MAFYQNLKEILDKRNLSNYDAAIKCGMNPQTIDNIINNKVEKPKIDTLEKLSKGLNVSINKLMYGADCFDRDIFDNVLKEKGISLDDLVIETGVDKTYIIDNIFPPIEQQEKVAKYLGVSVESVFSSSTILKHYLRNLKMKPYVRPDIDLVPPADEDMLKIYAKLSPTAKQLVYNLAYDLFAVETEYVVKLIRKDYWEK